MGEGHSKLSKSEANELAKSSNYNKQEVDSLWRDFKKVDKNGSGELDVAAFKLLFRPKMKSVSDEQLEKLFHSFDTDHSGSVSFKEFAVALSVVGKGSPREKLEYLFEIYDLDHNGTLTRDEIEKIVKEMNHVAVALGRHEGSVKNFINGIMDKLDVNKDGQISKDEWIEVGAKTPSVLTLLGL